MLNVSCNNLAFVSAANTSRSAEPILLPLLNVILHRGGGVFSLCRWDLMIISADISTACLEWLLWVNSLYVLLFSSNLTDPVFCFCSGNVIYERNCPALPCWGFLPFLGTVTLPRSFTSDLNTAGTALPPLHGDHECTGWSHMYQSVLQNLGVNRGNLSPAPPRQGLNYSRSMPQQLFHWATVVEHPAP